MKKTYNREFSLPEDKVVDDFGAFVSAHRRCLLFIEMIGLAAKDLCEPPGTELYEDSLQWLSDPRNMAAWCGMIEADQSVAPTITRAIKEKPAEIHELCQRVAAVAHVDRPPFERFMEIMKIPTYTATSSLPTPDFDVDYML